MRHLISFLFMISILSQALQAQKDTVYVRGYFESGRLFGTLEQTIEAVRDTGSVASTVFMLSHGERYILERGIVLEEGEHLVIAAPEPGSTQETAPPQIVWQPYHLFEDRSDHEVIIRTYANLTLTNIWIRYADVLGNQLSTGIVFEDDSTETGLNPDKEYGIFDGVIFDYFPLGPESGGAVTIKTDHFVGLFRNTYFRNGVDVHYQYYGQAVSFPYQGQGYHIDSLLFENTTFSNLSRIVTMEYGNYVSHLHLNHVTLINSIQWGIQSGWWEDLSITNSIFVNTNIYGYRPVDVCPGRREADFEDFEAGLCNPPGGGLVQDIIPADSLGFETDYTDQDRQVYIANNVYYHQPYLLDWYENSPWSQDLIQHGDDILLRFPPPAIGDKARAFYDSTGSDGQKVFPTMNVEDFHSEPAGFIEPPTNREDMLNFVMYKWCCGADVDWSYKPESGRDQVWPLPENLAYTNEYYQTKGFGRYPLGDLNWYPELKKQWEDGQREEDWSLINNWMTTGNATGTHTENPGAEVPTNFRLLQNYPNPFNPSTVISYQLPVNSRVTLKVFDLLGREVATLVDGRVAAGEHSVRFDASGLSTGVYIYQLKTEQFRSTRKMLLIK